MKKLLVILIIIILSMNLIGAEDIPAVLSDQEKYLQLEWNPSNAEIPTNIKIGFYDSDGNVLKSFPLTSTIDNGVPVGVGTVTAKWDIQTLEAVSFRIKANGAMTPGNLEWYYTISGDTFGGESADYTSGKIVYNHIPSSGKIRSIGSVDIKIKTDNFLEAESEVHSAMLIFEIANNG